MYYETGADPRSVAFADLDGDGRKDLVSANGTRNGPTNQVTVLKNTIGASCSGEVEIGVPHDRGDGSRVEDELAFDATSCP